MRTQPQQVQSAGSGRPCGRVYWNWFQQQAARNRGAVSAGVLGFPEGTRLQPHEELAPPRPGPALKLTWQGALPGSSTPCPSMLLHRVEMAERRTGL